MSELGLHVCENGDRWCYISLKYARSDRRDTKVHKVAQDKVPSNLYEPLETLITLLILHFSDQWML